MKFTAQWQKQFSQFIRNTMNWQYAFTTSTALSAFVYQYYQEKNHLPHSITSSNQKKSDLRIIDNNNFANSHFYSAFFYFYAFCLLDFLHPNKKFTTYALTGFTSALLLSLDARYTKLVDPKCVNTHHYFDQFASLSVYSATLLSPAMPFGAFLLLLELNQLHQKMLFKKYFDVNFCTCIIKFLFYKNMLFCLKQLKFFFRSYLRI